MKNLLVACDLDNTLIHSHRHRQNGDICVEWLEGREQSFLDPAASLLLQRAVQEVRFVPVTTRSVEQYQRIRWPEGCTPPFAAAANGAVLLCSGLADRVWLEESRKAVEPYQEELKRLWEVLSKMGRICRIVDGMYVFLSCADGEQAAGIAQAYQKDTPLLAAPSGRKLYFFPPEINKGTAVRRLQRKFGAKRIICAGDSKIDLPMLDTADLAVVPDEKLGGSVSGGRTAVCPAGDSFARFLLEIALEYGEKQI